MKAPTRKQAKAAAIQLHSLIVRHNATGCAAEGVLPGVCGTGRQCAHVIPKRQNSWIATDPDNGWVLCDGHHRMVDSNPARWLQLVQATVGVGWVACAQEACDRMREDLGMSSLRWWRRDLLRLIELADWFDVDISPLPVHIKQWAQSQKNAL